MLVLLASALVRVINWLLASGKQCGLILPMEEEILVAAWLVDALTAPEYSTDVRGFEPFAVL